MFATMDTTWHKFSTITYAAYTIGDHVTVTQRMHADTQLTSSTSMFHSRIDESEVFKIFLNKSIKAIDAYSMQVDPIKIVLQLIIDYLVLNYRLSMCTGTC